VGMALTPISESTPLTTPPTRFALVVLGCAKGTVGVRSLIRPEIRSSTKLREAEGSSPRSESKPPKRSSTPLISLRVGCASEAPVGVASETPGSRLLTSSSTILGLVMVGRSPMESVVISPIPSVESRPAKRSSRAFSEPPDGCTEKLSSRGVPIKLSRRSPTTLAAVVTVCGCCKIEGVETRIPDSRLLTASPTSISPEVGKGSESIGLPRTESRLLGNSSGTGVRVALGYGNVGLRVFGRGRLGNNPLKTLSTF
jgi:hypothetical protein